MVARPKEGEPLSKLLGAAKRKACGRTLERPPLPAQSLNQEANFSRPFETI